MFTWHTPVVDIMLTWLLALGTIRYDKFELLLVYMTHVVKIDIISGHEEKGNLHLILQIIFHCIFIEKPCIFSKFLQLIMRV